MDTFPNITPRYASPKNSLKRSLVADIGKHFKQRTEDGVNTDEESWDLTWVVDSTGALTIETFLEGKEGYLPFEWTPLDESTAIKFVCKQWGKSIIFAGWFQIQAKFERFYTHG